MTTPAKILIVGCGPTGLVAAATLKRHGVDVTIVDKWPSILKATKAAALHARTLEVFDSLGIADRIVEEGQKVEYLNLRTAREDKIIFSFKDLKDTKYPFMIDLSQYRVEEMLHNVCDELGVELRRAVKLTDLAQSGGKVHVTLQPVEDDSKTPKGDEENHTFDYVLGCDGANSSVRDMIGKAFSGESYAEPWALTDAKLDWPIPRNEMTFASSEDGICGVFPLQGEKHFRVAYTQLIDDDGNPIPPDEDNLKRALQRQGEDFKVHEVGKFWTFDLDHRQVDQYREGNVFLVGDAGHVHTPFGGQGLNLSVSDAFNIGWKLAAVANGQAGDDLLDTYNEERHPIAEDVIYFTHLGASAMLVRDGPQAFARDVAFNVINMPRALKSRIADQLSQLSHTYRDQRAFGGQAREGDRLPNVLYHDGYTDMSQRLHDVIRSGTLNLVCAVSGTREQPIQRYASVLAEAKRKSPVPLRTVLVTRFRVDDPERYEGVDAFILDRKKELSRAVAYDSHCFLVRPDSYLGERHVDVDAASILASIDRLYAADDRSAGVESEARAAA